MRAVGLWMRERDIVVLVTHSTNVLNTYYVPGTILGSGTTGKISTSWKIGTFSLRQRAYLGDSKIKTMSPAGTKFGQICL